MPSRSGDDGGAGGAGGAVKRTAVRPQFEEEKLRGRELQVGLCPPTIIVCKLSLFKTKVITATSRKYLKLIA